MEIQGLQKMTLLDYPGRWPAPCFRGAICAVPSATTEAGGGETPALDSGGRPRFW